jgi:uncharacterized protein (DUF362 family)
MNAPDSIPPPEPSQTRRAFLRNSLKAGAAIAATGGIAALVWDRHPPGTLGRGEAALSLPDFSVRDEGGKMAIITGADRVRTLRRGLDALGGIGRFIKRGDRVLVKVNAAFAAPAILSATTHPDVAAELVRLCRAAGASEVIVTDNPINDPESCFALTGIGAAVAAAGGTLALPRAGDFANGTLAGGRLIRDWPMLLGPFRGVTKLVGVAPVKDHARAGASMTIKNWYGLLGGRRNQFHQDINGIIVELAQWVRPTFVVLDGTTSMMTNGPTGGSLSDLKPTHTLIVGTDPVAADAFGATLLGKTHRDLPYLARAAACGCGTTDFDALKPARDSLS